MLLLLLLLHESPFAAGMPAPPRRRRRLCELDSSRGLLAGSLETAAPRRALAGAHMRNSGTAAKNTRGKGLGHGRGIYLLPRPAPAAPAPGCRWGVRS